MNDNNSVRFPGGESSAFVAWVKIPKETGMEAKSCILLRDWEIREGSTKIPVSYTHLDVYKRQRQ